MRREIKFRAWDKTNNKMIEHKQIVHNESCHLWGNFWDIFQRPGDFETMQFTGLKDKNGKEIYEGDIVRIVPDVNKKAGNEPYQEGFQYGDVVQVYWDYVNACFELLDEKNAEETSIGYYAGWSNWNWLEVIGNIYENPELIK